MIDDGLTDGRSGAVVDEDELDVGNEARGSKDEGEVTIDDDEGLMDEF